MQMDFDRTMAARGLATGIVTGLAGSLLAAPFDALPRLVGAADGFGFLLSAGLAFGLGLGFWLRREPGFAAWKLVLLLLAIPAAYALARAAAVRAAESALGDLAVPLLAPGLVGGAVGAAAVVAALRLLIAGIPAPPAGIGAVAAGALTGAVVLPLIEDAPQLRAMLALHISWHALVLAVLLGGIGRRA